MAVILLRHFHPPQIRPDHSAGGSIAVPPKKTKLSRDACESLDEDRLSKTYTTTFERRERQRANAMPIANNATVLGSGMTAKLEL